MGRPEGATLAANGRKKVVVSGLWTEVCNTTFALCAMLEGDYEIYMVADASGGTSQAAHDFAMQRMVQAGVVPVTWQQVLLEWQRDWARRDSYDAVMAIAKEHSGAYGMGVDYAYTMVHKAAQRTATPHESLAAVPASNGHRPRSQRPARRSAVAGRRRAQAAGNAHGACARSVPARKSSSTVTRAARSMPGGVTRLTLMSAIFQSAITRSPRLHRFPHQNSG